MGAAAYNRGSAAIRAELEREQQRTVLVRQEYLSGLEARERALLEEVDRLRAENAALKHQLDRAALRLRERSLTLTVERQEWAEQRSRLDGERMRNFRDMLHFKRCWQFVSSLLRRCASPTRVHEEREALRRELPSWFRREEESYARHCAAECSPGE